jgi:hypothetical protein
MKKESRLVDNDPDRHIFVILWRADRRSAYTDPAAASPSKASGRGTKKQKRITDAKNQAQRFYSAVPVSVPTVIFCRCA